MCVGGEELGAQPSVTSEALLMSAASSVGASAAPPTSLRDDARRDHSDSELQRRPQRQRASLHRGRRQTGAEAAMDASGHAAHAADRNEMEDNGPFVLD